MAQELLATEDGETHKLGSDFKVNYGVMVWEVGVRFSHQAAITPGII